MPLSFEDSPSRAGPRPNTTPTNPHAQLDQNRPEDLQREMVDFMCRRPPPRSQYRGREPCGSTSRARPGPRTHVWSGASFAIFIPERQDSPPQSALRGSRTGYREGMGSVGPAPYPSTSSTN